MSDLDHPQQRRVRLDANWSPWRSRTCDGLFGEAAARWGERVLVLGDGAALTYREAEASMARLANGLVAAGIRPGDRIALLMGNQPEFVVAKLAIARAGAIAVPLNAQFGLDELTYVLGQSGAVALLAADRLRDRDIGGDLVALRQRVPALTFIAVAGTEIPAGSVPMSELAGPPEPSRSQPDALSDIIYTSGTTGRPKGVMLTHDMVVRTGFACARVRALPDASRLLFVSPLYHVHGYVECLVAAMFVGGAIIPQAKFDPAAMLALAERHAATEISGVPTMTIRLLEAAATRGFDARSLVCVFNTGGLNQPGIWEDIRRLLQPREMVTAYGMSETTASTVCTLPEEPIDVLLTGNGRPKDAGPAGCDTPDRALARYHLADADGEIGELQVRGVQVTSGYWDNPDETTRAFTADGWLRTGDLGRIGVDGEVTFVGRAKEAYRCGGEMVMPREVELVLEEDGSVAQAFVVGVPDVRMEEVGCACIVLREGAALDAEGLIARCASRLARYKVPRHVLAFAADEIPLTPTLRPQKFRLVAIARERLAL